LDTVTPIELTRQGHAALARHAWTEALDLFRRADEESGLGPADLEGLAEAAWFSAQSDASIAAKERAFQGYQNIGESIPAANIALDLFQQYSYKGKPSIGSAWLRRGEKLLEDQPESPPHGFLAITKAWAARNRGDLEAAIANAQEAVAIGARTGNRDVQALAMTALGAFRVAKGEADAGFELLEEAATAAVSGELSTFMTGVATCNVIAACRDLSDFQRAREWTEAAEAWCERESVSGFPGVCRIHRAEVVALSGAWERAEQELRQATSELEAYNAVPPMSDGFYAIAQIRFRKGDLEGSEEALRQAHSLGHSLQPLLAYIRLAQGKVETAANGLATELGEQAIDRLARTRLLPAQVEVAIAQGETDVARRASEELATLAETYRSPLLEATKHEALGRTLIAEGDTVGAARELRASLRHWREVKAPYEIARVRAMLATALRNHDEDGADLELEAARNEFARLGAAIDLENAEREIRAVAERRRSPTKVRKTFMFTDIVGSTNLADTLGNEAWGLLLQWHDDALRSSFAKQRGEVVNSTGDGFFVAFDSARKAIDCAISIQRALAEHRRSTGFAPMVRIGVHTAEANQRSFDYSGLGVNVAARVAGEAGGGEIAATIQTLDEAGDVTSDHPREVVLKGVAEPVQVVTVVWE
jgi:class 3 adenylate cyclase